jgi:hypothetical protein
MFQQTVKCVADAALKVSNGRYAMLNSKLPKPS